MHPVEKYLTQIREIASTGSARGETSFYRPLAELFNAVGEKLKPAVSAVDQLADVGAGSPDFGLFTKSQYQRWGGEEPLREQKPERGVVEAKGWKNKIEPEVSGPQVAKYLQKYDTVLLSNLWHFILLEKDGSRPPLQLEEFRLVNSSTEFAELLKHPKKAADEHGERFTEFLKRVLLHRASLGDPSDVAWFLASYAREARYRINARKDSQGLGLLQKSLEDALGLKFEGEKGANFFHATLVQTLFYGVFSAWVLWCRGEGKKSGTTFDWRLTGHLLHVPMIRSLFHQIGEPGRLKEIGIDETLNWTGRVLDRVNRAAFFDKFEEEHAVQYFYEPFLKAYDPELRKELGVWYTPPEIVKYQVARVDTVLREELGIAKGLADPDVIVLDPCCGTGAYLVEVLNKIREYGLNNGNGGLVPHILKKEYKERIFGFELLPAPYVIAHLQLGLYFQNLGIPLDAEKNERAGVYLTNALTGWEPPREPKNELPFPEFQIERDLANSVKRDKAILVILGNPPYNGFAGLAIDEERDLTNAYRTTKKGPQPEGQGLNDLYVRFYRMAERRIVEKSGKGVVCFISNYSWLEGLSHSGMRERYLEVFDKIWIDSLNGDKYRTGKLTPEGDPDPSVFSTDLNKEGIQVGTAIALLCRRSGGAKKARSGVVYFRDLWGRKKCQQLLNEAEHSKTPKHGSIKPVVDLGHPFSHAQIEKNYISWPELPELFPVSFPGVKTSRDEFLVDIDKGELEKRIQTYLDSQISDEEIATQWPGIMNKTPRFNARQVRAQLIKRKKSQGRIVSYAYRPFDVRWLYWEPETKLLDEKRSDYFPHVLEQNSWIAAVQKNRRLVFYKPEITSHLADHHLFESNCGMFPLFLKREHSKKDRDSNLTETAFQYIRDTDTDPQALFHHAIAILHSSAFAEQNLTALRYSWPRIPLPKRGKILKSSSQLGLQVAALFDMEMATPDIGSSALLKRLAVFTRNSGPKPRPDELDLTANWGHAGKGGVCMPGKGKIVSRKADDPAQVKAFGEETLDIYLNDVAYWKNVPKPVWDYTIGGYQVIKKWLSYREKAILGRGLTVEEAWYVSEMARRIAALILLQPELDANYEAVKADTYPWPAESPDRAGAGTGGGDKTTSGRTRKSRRGAAYATGSDFFGANMDVQESEADYGDGENGMK